MLIGDLLTRAARYYSDKPATIYKDIRLNFKELNESVNRIGNAILNSGITKGDRIGIICHNSHFYQQIFFASVKIGAVITTINWRLAPREMEFIITDAEVKLLFIAKQFWPQIEPIKDKLKEVRHFVLIDGDIPDTIQFEDFLGTATSDDIQLSIPDTATVWQIYTSGTTGRPKGVLLTHHGLLVDAEHNIIGNKLNLDKSIWIQILPMFHIALKFMIIALYVKACVVFIDKFDLKLLCEAIEQEKSTRLIMGPTMWQLLADYQDLPNYDLSSLKYCAYSTAPMPPTLIKRLIQLFPDMIFYSTYGLTEAGSTLTILPADQHILNGPDHLVKRLSSLGRPIDGIDIRIVDDKNDECPPCKIGEIIARGDNIMKGYWKLPEETKETIREGWLYTGDMGYWDEYGYIYIADRKKDMIISGGENIYPNEVENIIREIEGVVDVTVIGVPDDKWGEAVKAIIVKSKGSILNEKDIIGYCATNIASYKKPKSVDFVKEIPRSPVGKVLKRELKEKYWQGYKRKI